MTSIRHHEREVSVGRVTLTPKVFPGLPKRKMAREQILASQFMAESFSCGAEEEQVWRSGFYRRFRSFQIGIQESSKASK